MQNSIIEKIERSQEKKRPKVHVGDRVNVSVRLKEGDKERVQGYRGIVTSVSPKSGRGSRTRFTVRKVTDGVGIERIFALHSPRIEKIDVEARTEVRRGRLYYIRNLIGKKGRLKESEAFADLILPEARPEEEILLAEGVADIPDEVAEGQKKKVPVEATAEKKVEEVPADAKPEK